MKRYVALLLGLALLLVSVAVIPASGAKRAWKAIAGGGTQDISVVVNAFSPRTLEIGVGDTVTWQIIGFHNIAFPGGGQPLPAMDAMEGDNVYVNPRVAFPAGGATYDGTTYTNSGLPQDPSKPFTYSLTFTKAGTYTYICIVHGPAMSGKVIVGKAMGSPAAVEQQAKKAMAASIQAGQSAWKKFATMRQGSEVVVPLIGDVRAGYSILRFTPQPLRVAVGTTVTWKMADLFEIHTVTFLGGQKPPEFVLVQPQSQGPPKLQMNPAALKPSGGKTYDGMGIANSGVLYPPIAAPANLPKSYSLTFTKAGTYEYWCLVHVPEGMKGTIIVQ
jgi:plastocyanin